MKTRTRKYKATLIENYISQFNCSRSQAEREVDFVFNYITKTLKSGGEILIAKFGKFAIKKVAKRNARNPKTGEKLVVPAMNRIKFSSSKAFKNLVN